jgi:hypothetical protein
MRRILLVIAAAAMVTIAAGWFVASRLPRWLGGTETAAATPTPPAPQGPERKIRVSLFYVSEDGTQLVGIPSEVPFADDAEDQARRIVEEQLKPAPSPYAQAVPAGTSVRAVFVTDRKDAFVDLSPEVTSAHTGGSLDELFSVYAIVNALTMNLPAIERVQILVDGREVDSLAGHVDLRRPLPSNTTWVAQPPAPSGEATTPPASAVPSSPETQTPPPATKLHPSN